MTHYAVLELSSSLPLQAVGYYPFETAKATALFMWARSVGRHLIYKDGKLAYLAHLYSDVTELQDYLERLNPDGSLCWKVNSKGELKCIFCGAIGGRIHADNCPALAFNPDGTVKC